MYEHIKEHIASELENMKRSGLWKEECMITSPQGVRINVSGRQNVLNMCANNYLGLANHPDVINAAKESYELYGYGLSSVRFICGTQNVHKTLERKISEFLGTEDTILYSSCFDANGGFFETIFSEQDAIISDELNHASIIDGIRLCKASRYRYRNNDMDDLEMKLKEAQNARFRVIVTDGVFSMDGILANLPEICNLAEDYNALVMVDDSHAVGFIGENGRGTPEYFGVSDKVDILTGTLGKALGGASGGYTSGKKEIISLLRQRSRPYLFSNTLAPSIAYSSLKVLEIITESKLLMRTLMNNAAHFRKNLQNSGFDIKEGIHPIVPVMIKDTFTAQKMSDELFSENIYVKAFVYPVVPLGKARIRTQVSTAHTTEDLDFAAEAFKKVAYRLGVFK